MNRLPSLYETTLFALPLLAALQRPRHDDVGPHVRTLDAETLPSVLVGTVLTPDGQPARGAVVVGSAGGEAVTDADGSFWLEFELPLDAQSVQVTAVQGSGTAGSTASVRILLDHPGGVNATGFLPLSSGGACQPEWLPEFGQAPGVAGVVYAVAVFDDESGAGPALYVAGNFSTAGGVAVSRIAKWDGSHWSAVGSGLSSHVYALTVFDDGSERGPSLYAGGLFAGRIAKWDGTTWKTVGGGVNATVYAFTTFDDGSGPALIVGGDFTSAGGVGASKIAKWDGTSWSTLGTGMNGSVYALATFDDGSGAGLALYAGGDFSSAGGAGAIMMAKWDGASWSPLSSGMDDVVTCLTVFDAGSGPALYAGGYFTTAGGILARRIAKWDGTSWAPLGNGANDGVGALAVFDDGSGGGPALVVGGEFTAAGVVAARHIAKWNGTSWSKFSGGTSDWVGALAVFDGGGESELYAGGAPGTADGLRANGIARWNGTRWETLGHGLSNEIEALAEFDDGGGPQIYAGGGGFPSTGPRTIARWTGTGWSSVGSGIDSAVFAIKVFDDGSGGGPALYIGGAFTRSDDDFGRPAGGAANGIARWDGANWLSLGDGVNSTVYALAEFDDGSGGGPALYAGGRFTSATGISASRIAKWDGATWAPLGPGLISDDPTRPAVVHALTVFDDGSGPALFAGGMFTDAGAVPVYAVARWDGASWSDLGFGELSEGRALAVFDDGSGSGPALYAGGSFGVPGGGASSNVAKWDGTSWSALGSGTSRIVEALVVFDDGSGAALYAGGRFETAGGVAASRIAKWDGATWSPLGSGTSDNVGALAVFDDGSSGPALVVGGQFTTAFDSGDSFVARWQGCIDTAAPTLSHPVSVVKGEVIGSAPGEIVTFTVTASDFFDPAPLVVCVPPSGSFFPRGTTLVTCTATDAMGNQSTGEFPVTVALKVRKTGF